MHEEPRNMKRGSRLGAKLWLSAALALTSASCAVQGGAPVQENHPSGSAITTPAARLGLAPALRPFYDELEPYGDWVLVEPLGWVFRPRVNTVAWRPYQDGHWEPSYAFGWVWESDDPFGWITDHYGFWYHDSFQGWVWQPFGAWAPSWVAWVQVGDYVGWAPLPPANAPSYGDLPGGLFTYMPARSLGQAGPGASSAYVKSLPDDGSALKPIERVASYQDVYFNSGPDLGDVLGVAAADRLRLDERDGRAVVPGPSRRPAEAAQRFELGVLEERSRRAWSVARREFADRGRAPAGGGSGGGPRIQPVSPPASPPPAPKITPDHAPSDTLRKGSAADSLRKRFKKGVRPKPGHPRP